MGIASCVLDLDSSDVCTMRDLSGNELQLNDRVAFCLSGKHGLKTGIVVGFSKQRIRVEYEIDEHVYQRSKHGVLIKVPIKVTVETGVANHNVSKMFEKPVDKEKDSDRV